MCGPCSASGNAWQFASFLSGHDRSDKQEIQGWLNKRGLLKSPRPRATTKRESVATTYAYTDLTGKILYEKVRFEPKGFSIRRPDGTGGWLRGLGNVDTVLYNLPEVLNAQEIIYVEGEKDVETARKMGFVATTSGSAMSWRQGFAEHFRDRSVYVIADADEPGRKHAAIVAADVKDFAASLCTLEMPGAKDLTEWFDQGGDRASFEELLRVSHAAQNRRSESIPAKAPADGLDVVALVERFLYRYLILPRHAAFPLACWTVATYLYRSFDSFPYLAVVSPTKQCGKTRLAEVLSCMVLSPRMTTGISEAALFRLVNSGNCTLLLDEAESLKETRNERSQAIVSILNAGYRQGNPVFRCANAKHELQEFSTYCPKVMMAIGTLPSTVFDRSIVIPMRRKKPGDRTGRYISRHARAESADIRQALESLQTAHSEKITEVYENLPEFLELSDRDEEIWQPLLTICTVLCPQRLEELKQSALALCRGKADSDVDDSLSLRLLSDLSSLLPEFGDGVPSAHLTIKLRALEGSPWNEPGHELTQNRLARLLRPFEITPRTIRVGTEQTPKGYLKEQISEAIALYVGS